MSCPWAAASLGGPSRGPERCSWTPRASGKDGRGPLDLTSLGLVHLFSAMAIEEHPDSSCENKPT
eukprot:7355840-Pyramimonas_sp.AAC.1